jgi:hypothetical protein
MKTSTHKIVIETKKNQIKFMKKKFRPHFVSNHRDDAQRRQLVSHFERILKNILIMLSSSELHG